MADRVEVVKAGTGQLLWFDATEGRPSAMPTVGTKDQGGAALTAAVTTFSTLDTANTTINASAAVGAKTLTLTAVTGIVVGRDYLITNAIGQSERVLVTGINSSSMVVNIDEGVEYTYAAADTFVGTRFSYALQTADIASLAEFNVATATYLVGGITRTHAVAYDTVLHPLENPLTVAGIKSRWPDLSQQEFEEQRGEDYARQRADAWEMVKRELRRLGRRPALIVSSADLEDWAYSILALYLTEAGINVLRGVDTSEALEYWRGKAMNEKAELIASLQWYDIDEDEAKSELDGEVGRIDFFR